MPDPRLKSHPSVVVRHLGAAGGTLARRQEKVVGRRGNVPPWPGADEVDFHGTLAAIWIWARHERLSGLERFAAARATAWTFCEIASKRFVPESLDSAVDDEAAYDCAMVLIAGAAEAALTELEGRRASLVERAARVLANHLHSLEFLSGREFRDPGLLAFALVDYARATDDRGLLSVGRRFVERAFGMKAPAPFVNEPAAAGGLFDFSSTTATRILAVIASEGTTPFVGAWLRERIAAGSPPAFVRRRMDESCWNACVAWALGRAYVVSTDPAFLTAYGALIDELHRRDLKGDGTLARGPGMPEGDTLATFYFALAVDSLVTEEAAIAAQWEALGG
jgi:hypothetical protein